MLNKKLNIKPIHIFILIFIILFTLMRFINVDSNLPVEFNGYAKGEVVHIKSSIDKVSTGKWYKEGVFNSIITSPVLNIINYTIFSIFGMSITIAKLLSTICFLLQCLILFLFIKQYFDTTESLLVILFISHSYYFYIFSRTAFPDMIMLLFVMISLIVSLSTKLNKYFKILLAVSILFLACLIKISAIFALPVLIYITASENNSSHKYLLPIYQILLFMIFVMGYYVFVSKYYTYDINQYITLFLDLDFSYSFASFLKMIEELQHLVPILFPLSIFLSLLMFIGNRSYRKNELVRISYIWIISHLIISIIINHTVKYNVLPLIIPLYILLAYSIKFLVGASKIKNDKLVTLVVVTITIIGFGKIGPYIINQTNSFVTVSNELEEYINKKEKPESHNIRITGDEIKRVSLQTGIRSIVTHRFWLSSNISQRLIEYTPDYYVHVKRTKEIYDTLKHKINSDSLGIQLDEFNLYEKNVFNYRNYTSVTEDTLNYYFNFDTLKTWNAKDIKFSLYKCELSNDFIQNYFTPINFDKLFGRIPGTFEPIYEP